MDIGGKSIPLEDIKKVLSVVANSQKRMKSPDTRKLPLRPANNPFVEAESTETIEFSKISPDMPKADNDEISENIEQTETKLFPLKMETVTETQVCFHVVLCLGGHSKLTFKQLYYVLLNLQIRYKLFIKQYFKFKFN